MWKCKRCGDQVVVISVSSIVDSGGRVFDPLGLHYECASCGLESGGKPLIEIAKWCKK